MKKLLRLINHRIGVIVMPLVNKPSGIKSIKNLGKIEEETYGKIVFITTTNENIGNLQKTVVFVAADKGYILKIS